MYSPSMMTDSLQTMLEMNEKPSQLIICVFNDIKRDFAARFMGLDNTGYLTNIIEYNKNDAATAVPKRKRLLLR